MLIIEVFTILQLHMDIVITGGIKSK